MMADHNAPDPLTENTDSAAPPSRPAETPPVRSRFLLLILLAGIPLCAAAGSTTWWMRKTYLPPSAAVYEPPSPRTVRYNDTATLNMESLTPEVMAVLDRLAAPLETLDADFAAAEERRRGEDPHLARALDDPVNTPFRPENPIRQENFSTQFLPIMDLMVDDYLRHSQEDPQAKQVLAEAMRRCLRATMFRHPVADSDRALLEEQGSEADPLVLLCLYRCVVRFEPGNTERMLELITQAQSARDRRPVIPEVGALISSNLMQLASKLSPDDRGAAVEAFIQDTVDVWQKHPKTDADFAVQEFYLTYLSAAWRRLGTYGKFDLLLEIDHRGPAVPSFLAHFTASRIFWDAAQNYRGTDYISNVAPEHLRRFSDLADQAAKHLMRAWTLAPQQPLPPELLMSMEMRAGSTPRSIDAWFRHTMAACYGNRSAFDVYEISAEDKWGGSREKAIWLAKMCAETEDLETGIALRFTRPLNLPFQQSAEAPRKLFSDLSVRRIAHGFVRTLQTHSRTDPHPSVGADIVAYTAAILWHSGDFDEVNWLLSVYKSAVECNRFHRFRLHLDEIQIISAAVAADPLSAWATAYRLLYGDTRRLSQSDLTELSLALAELRETHDENDSPQGKIIARMERLTDMLRGLSTNQTVTLTSHDLGDWVHYGRSLNLVVPPEESSGEGDRREQVAEDIPGTRVEMSVQISSKFDLLTCPVLVEPPVSLEMDVEQLSGVIDFYGISLLIGPHYLDMERSGYRGVILTVDGSHSRVIRDHLPRADWYDNVQTWEVAEPRAKYTVRLEVFPDGYRTYLGEQEIETVRTPMKTGGLLHIGRYCRANYWELPDTVAKFRISNVRLRRPAVNSLAQVTEFY